MKSKAVSFFSFLLFCLFSASIHSLCAQTSEEVISKFFEVIGGKEKVKEIRSARIQMAVSTQGIVLAEVSKSVADKRGSLTLILTGGTEIVECINPKGIWVRGPEDEEPIKQKLTAKELEGLANKLSIRSDEAFLFMSFLSYEGECKGFELKKRKKKIGKKKCYVLQADKEGLEVMENCNKGGGVFSFSNSPMLGGMIEGAMGGKGVQSIDLYFSVKTGLLLRLNLNISAISGDFMKITLDFSDYREAGGLFMPHALKTSLSGVPEMEGATFTSKITAIRLNPDFPDDLFTIEEGEYALE